MGLTNHPCCDIITSEVKGACDYADSINAIISTNIVPYVVKNLLIRQISIRAPPFI